METILIPVAIVVAIIALAWVICMFCLPFFVYSIRDSCTQMEAALRGIEESLGQARVTAGKIEDAARASHAELVKLNALLASKVAKKQDSADMKAA